jgi:homoserine kinase
VPSPEFVETPVVVRSPATSANLGPGFDALGLALTWYDEVEVTVVGSDLAIEVDGEGIDSVPRDESHLVIRSLRAAIDTMGGHQPAGLAVRCHNRIPHGRGLGSSAAAIVSGVIAARALLPDGRSRLDDRVVLRLAAGLEGHPDNVAACLLGGLTVAWTDTDGARALRTTPAGLRAVALVPPDPVSTVEARGLLPETVPHDDAARNAGRAALLVAALASGGPADVLLAATDDRLHQAYRAPAMRESYDLVQRLRSEGTAAIVSGAGPTVLALLAAEADPDRVAGQAPAGWRSHRLEIDGRGAHIRE